MFIGGILIRRFDGFRRAARWAADQYGHPLTITEEDMLLANRVLAALGGPPAPAEVRGRFSPDGLPTLLLFLLTQENPCRVGLIGDPSPVMGQLKGLVHLLGHAVCPLISGQPALPFQEVVRELGPTVAALRPLLQYDQEGDPIGFQPEGAAGLVRTGPEGGPYTLAVLLGEGAGPAPLEAAGGPLRPAVLILS